MWNYTETPERILLEIKFSGGFDFSIEKAYTDITVDKIREYFPKVRVEP